MDQFFQSIVNQFNVEGAFISADAIDTGHINDTYRVVTNGKHHQKYILQRTISVDIRYVLFIIDKYAGATNIIKELNLKSN